MKKQLNGDDDGKDDGDNFTDNGNRARLYSI